MRQAVTGAGRVIAGRYELLDLLGQGAMGTVWHAHDPVLAREVAVKEIRLPALMSEADRRVLRERTLREARVAGKLSHPGVVTVYDVVEADGNPWIVMELVPARSLEKVLAQDGPLPPQQVSSIGVMLLEALASAHAAGIIHRDVKPANVLVTGDGRAVLTDFGIATLEGEAGLTQVGMVMGTPGFCAPERIRGEPASPASDLWSLGATLFAAVEGRSPYQSHETPMAVLARIVHSDPPQAESAGPLRPLISALMSRDPAQRPDAASAARMLAAVPWEQPAGPPVIVPPQQTDPAADVPWPWPPRSSVGDPARTQQPGRHQGWHAAPGPAAGLGSATGLASATGPDGAPGVHAREDLAAAPVPAGLPADPYATLSPSIPATPAAIPRPQPSATPHPAPSALAQPTPHAPAPSAPTQPTPHAPAHLALPASSAPGALTATAPARHAAPASTQRLALGRGTERLLRGRWFLAMAAAVVIVCAGLLVGVITSARGAADLPPARGNGPGTGVAGLPAGYRWYSVPASAGSAGFSMAVPDGWTAHHRGAATVLLDPAARAQIRVTGVPPGARPLAALFAIARQAPGGRAFPSYRRIASTLPLPPGSIALAFHYLAPRTGRMEGVAVFARLGPPRGRQARLFTATAPIGDWGKVFRDLREALRTFTPQA